MAGCCQRRNENALKPPVWNCVFFGGSFFRRFSPKRFFLLPFWLFFAPSVLL
jgi:hypothetical protein